MSSCSVWHLDGDVGIASKKNFWKNLGLPISNNEKPQENCFSNLQFLPRVDTRTIEKDAGVYLIELLNARTEDQEEQLEKKMLEYSAEDVFLAGIANGSDEALAKTRYLLRSSGDSMWMAWQQLANNLDIYPAADFIADLSSSPVIFTDIAREVFLKIAKHNDEELQLMLLEYIDEIHSDLRRPVLISLTKSIYPEVARESSEALVVHGDS